MPSKAAEQKIVTLVPQKGVNLPVSECVLTKETPEEYLVQAAAKTGRGRGVKYVLRTFRIPKKEVLYVYKEEEISAEVAGSYPMNGATASVKAAVVAPADAPKKRGRPKSAKKAAAVATDAAPKKRGRPKKEKVEATDAAPKKRGRPKKEKVTEAAADAPAAPKKRGRKKGTKKAAAPTEAAPTEAATKKAAAKSEEPKKAAPTKAASIFDEDF